MFLEICGLLFVFFYVVKRFVRSLKIDSFADKYVVITGCDSGFGRELAMRLDTLGFHVFAGCLTDEGTKSLSSSCSSRLHTFPLDITQVETIDKALQFVKEKLPEEKGIWALVNNAGILGNLSTFELCIKQDFSKVLEVNLLGPMQVIQRFLPLLRKSKGRVVNITSMLGRFPLFGVPYCVSKSALEALSNMLRRSVYGQGISVSVIEPGGFNTSMINIEDVKREMKLSLQRASPEVQDVYTKQLSEFLASTQELTLDQISLVSAHINPVIDAYTHAITAKYPCSRYVVGNDAKYVFIPLSFLPTDVSDAILRIAIRMVRGFF